MLVSEFQAVYKRAVGAGARAFTLRLDAFGVQGICSGEVQSFVWKRLILSLDLRV